MRTATAMKTVEFHAADFCNELYLPHLRDQRRRQIYFGGSSSGKSKFLAQREIIDMMAGRNYLNARRTAKTLRSSVWSELNKVIDEFGVGRYFKAASGGMVLECRLSGAQALFVGMDDPEKVKSISPKRGVLTDVWIEEATEVSNDGYKQLTKRVRGASPFVKRVTLSFNPVLKSHWIYREFFDGLWRGGGPIENGELRIDNQDESAEGLTVVPGRYVSDGRVGILKSTYRDNRFLSADDIDELENEPDAYYRAVYTNGDWGVLGQLVFTTWESYGFPREAEWFDAVSQGADFGYNDPSVMLSLGRRDGTVYVRHEFYRRKLTNTELIREVSKDPLFDPEADTIADSAEPDRIREWQAAGWYMTGVDKRPGYLKASVDWLKGRKIIVHPSCVKTIEELRGWEYLRDRTSGEYTDKPADINDHAMSALRYGTRQWMKYNEI